MTGAVAAPAVGCWWLCAGVDIVEDVVEPTFLRGDEMLDDETEEPALLLLPTPGPPVDARLVLDGIVGLIVRAAIIHGSLEKERGKRRGQGGREGREELTAKSRFRLKTTVRVPGQALGDKVDKELVVRLEDLRERLRARTTPTALRVDDRTRRSSRIWSKTMSGEVPSDKEGLGDGPKKRRFRELRSTRYFSGSPMTSIMHASCSCSFSPGKIG